MSVIVTESPATVTVETLDEVDEVLIKAENILNERGWHQGSLSNSRTGEVCIVGAISIALGAPEPDLNMPIYAFPMFYRVIAKLRKTLKLDPMEATPVPIWNDELDRTKEEVIELLREARTH